MSPARVRRVFIAAVAIIACDAVLFTMVVPALADYADRWSLSEPQAALIFGAFPVAQLASATVAGRAADRHGRRPLLIAGAAALIVASLIFAFAWSPLVLVAARAVQGAAAGIAWTAALAMVYDVYPPERIGFRMGLAQTAAGVSGLLGPLVGGVAIDVFGTRAAFASAALLPLVPLGIALGIPETRRAGVTGSPAGGMRRLFRQPAARAAGLALLTAAAVTALLEPLVPLDLSRRLDLTPGPIGLVFGAMLIAYFAATPLAGRRVDRHGARDVLLAGGLLTLLALPLVALLPAAGVAVALAGVGLGMAGLSAPAGPLFGEAVADAGMANALGVAGGAHTLVFSLGYAVGPLLAAGASAVMPFAATLTLAALLTGLATAGALRELARVPAAAPREARA